ncbi:MAG TPA: hypothetical protein VGI39_38980, partial [Polyangiaceae bacterium]
MKMWRSKWVLAMGGAMSALVGVVGLTESSVQAQTAPKPATAAPADAGAAPTATKGAATPAPAASAGTMAVAPGATPAQAGSAATAAAGDGGAAPAPAASGTTAPAAPVAATVATVHPLAPPPPPPTPQQLAAYQALKQETDAFEVGARDYRDTVTTIIRLHYEAKKKEILSGLDGEITAEQAELKKARETAIKRLEEFIATYSGPRARDPETPDAMYRLAALYEERARDSTTEDISGGLKPAIALYKRIINEYPAYKQTAAIYYFLAHAYEDSGRNDEAQQVYRSSVCHNHFKYPTAPNPKNPEQDTVLPLPQDHDEEYWSTWRNLHQDPASLKKGGADTVYIDPYPADCVALPQPDLQPGVEPKYVAETWWNIGNWEFDQLDQGGGVVKDEPAAVFDYDRAASAYVHSMQYHKEP